MLLLWARQFEQEMTEAWQAYWLTHLVPSSSWVDPYKPYTCSARVVPAWYYPNIMQLWTHLWPVSSDANQSHVYTQSHQSCRLVSKVTTSFNIHFSPLAPFWSYSDITLMHTLSSSDVKVRRVSWASESWLTYLIQALVELSLPHLPALVNAKMSTSTPKDALILYILTGSPLSWPPSLFKEHFSDFSWRSLMTLG